MDRLSKNVIKQIKTLRNKKTRIEENSFVAEGEKIVNELIHSSYKIDSIIGLKEWIDDNVKQLNIKNIKTYCANEEELSSISSLKTPNKVLAVAHIAENIFDIELLKDKLTLALDDIQDPGNFGTIIRLADWFGIQNVICSENSVDVYNSKVIQASMGAFLRVNVVYLKLPVFFSEYKNKVNQIIYGAALKVESIYNTNLDSSGLIVLGNEARGISHEINPFINRWITIPSFNLRSEKTESLNVSIATAIICSEFRRRVK